MDEKLKEMDKRIAEIKKIQRDFLKNLYYHDYIDGDKMNQAYDHLINDKDKINE